MQRGPRRAGFSEPVHQRPGNNSSGPHPADLNAVRTARNPESPRPCEKALTDRDSLEMLCCGHSRQRLPRPAGDTSHPVFEARSQLSVTGTPLGINVSGAVAAARGPGASCVLTGIFCLLPEGLLPPPRCETKAGTSCFVLELLLPPVCCRRRRKEILVLHVLGWF